jgi:[acyl-carrier-protein] S-malonyltransferase
MEKIGFLFAGQGSQYVGMGKDLYEAFPESKAVFDKTERILGFELKKRCFEGPQEFLKMTNISQPAIVSASLAAFAAFNSKISLKADFVAGLSLGEYTALIAAQSLALEDGIRLIKKRGELMETAATKYPGKMAAVLDLAPDKVKEICLAAGAEIANLNCPGQIVISGKSENIDKAIGLCLKAGAKKVIPLEVSGAFHSSLMFEPSVELKFFLENIAVNEPNIPVVSNYTATPQSKSSLIRENLVYQMRSPVRWEESMRFMLGQGVTKFYEFGPGKVLKGLMRKIEPSVQVINIEKKEDILSLAG